MKNYCGKDIYTPKARNNIKVLYLFQNQIHLTLPEFLLEDCSLSLSAYTEKDETYIRPAIANLKHIYM